MAYGQRVLAGAPTGIAPHGSSHTHTLESATRTTHSADDLQHTHTIETATLYGGMARASQLLIESMGSQPTGAARSSQLLVESIQDVEDTSAPPLRARPSQFMLETMRSLPVFGYVSQFVLELLRTVDDQPPIGPRGFYFGRVGGNDILKYGLDHRDDP